MCFIQVEYDSIGQNKDECFANTFSKSVYDDDALTGGKLSRNPSVRRAGSRDTDEVAWRRLRALPHGPSEIQEHIDKSPDVFVPTKRTIFTVQGGTSNSEQARATPTFVESQDDELETGTEPEVSSEAGTGDERESRVGFEGGSQETETRTEHKSNTDHMTNISKKATAASSPALQQKHATRHQRRGNERRVNNTESLSLGSSSVEELEQNSQGLDDDSHDSSENQNTESLGEDVSSIPNLKEDETRAETELTPPVKVANGKDVCRSSAGGGVPPAERGTASPVGVIAATSVTASLLQLPPPTSPPIESKKKVLEAANEGIPAVRNIIKKFNQRITENQELLGSPFRSPPSSPPWHSPRTQRKLLADLSAGHKYGDQTPKDKVSVSSVSNSQHHPLSTTPVTGVLKSQSASVIVSNPENTHHMQRSVSGSCCQVSVSSSSEAHLNLSSSNIFSPPLSVSKDPLTGEAWKVSPSVSPVPTDLDTSCDMDQSADDSLHPSQDRSGSSSQTESRSPAGHLRALRIKRAKEEFLSRGATTLKNDNPLNDAGDPVKLRHSSGTASTENSWRESGEFCAMAPSPTPTETSLQEREETHDKPPKAAPRRRNIPKKESFRRQSAGCLMEESSSPSQHSSQVVKSASSGVLASNKRHSRCSIDSQSPDRRKASLDPSTDSTKPLGIFRIFRRNRSKDKKDMPAIQRLCRQSLLVDFANGRNRTQSPSPQPCLESQLRVLQEVDGEDGAHSSKTLPRGSSIESPPPAPSRSCPSSPVAPHRSRTANWLARGRKMFKSRSPSPGKKSR